MFWDAINTIINIIVAIFSISRKPPKHIIGDDDVGEFNLPYYAELLDGTSESQHLIAIKELCEYARNNKSYNNVICEMLCSHVKRINAFEVSKVSGDFGNSSEIKKILDILFVDDSIFKEEQKDLQNTVFVNWKLSKKNSIRNVNFSGSRFLNCEFHDVVLYNCKMSEAVIDNCTFKNGTEFNKCLLNNAFFRNNTLFRNVVMKDTTFKGAKIADVQFVRTDLDGIIFYNAEISNSIFINCEINRADFTYVDFYKVLLKFKSLELMRAQIKYFDSQDLNYIADVNSYTILL